jgi:hypothetical protein
LPDAKIDIAPMGDGGAPPGFSLVEAQPEKIRLSQLL